MNEQTARNIAAKATGTLVAQYAEAVQLGDDWVVVLALNAMTEVSDTHQLFTTPAEWSNAHYIRYATGMGAYALYGPAAGVAVLYVDDQPAHTNTMHFDTMPTRQEVQSWTLKYMNAKLNFVLAEMYANGVTELAE